MQNKELTMWMYSRVVFDIILYGTEHGLYHTCEVFIAILDLSFIICLNWQRKMLYANSFIARAKLFDVQCRIEVRFCLLKKTLLYFWKQKPFLFIHFFFTRKYCDCDAMYNKSFWNNRLANMNTYIKNFHKVLLCSSLL